MPENETRPHPTRSAPWRLLVQLVRLPFDLLFLTWDYLRLTWWVIRNLRAFLSHTRVRPFAPLFAHGVVQDAAEGTLWYCSLAPKYGTKSLLRLLFRRLRWCALPDGRRHLCWKGSRGDSPTSPVRFLVTGLLLGCLWLIPAGALAWRYRHHLPLGRTRGAGEGVPGPGAAAAVRPDPGQAARLLTEAAENEGAGRMEQARAAYRLAAAQDPALLEAHLGLGRTSMKLGFPGDARLAFSRALELAPYHNEAMLGLARALHSLDADRRALEILGSLRERAPDSAEARALECACHLALGDTEAAAAIEKGLLLAPDDPDTLAAAAETELKRNRLDQAERHYRKLVDRAVGDVRGRVGLARILRLKGNLAEAREALDAVLAEDPNEVPAIEELLEVQLAAGKPLEALETCRTKMEANPGSVSLRQRHLAILFALGRDNDLYVAATKLLGEDAGNLAAHTQLAAMFLRRGLPSLAIEHCQKALSQQPAAEAAFRLLVSAQIAAGALEPARERLEKLLAVYPRDLDGLLKLAEYHRRKQDVPAAMATLRKAVEYHPGSPIAHSQLAQVLFLSGDTAGALSEFREALRCAPDDPKALNNVAAALVYAQGDLDEALACAEKAYARERGNPQVMDTLAWVLARRGAPEKAVLYSELAVALQPELPNLRYHYGAILAALGRREEAAAALRAALASPIDFHGKADARALLESLSAPAAGAGNPVPEPRP